VQHTGEKERNYMSKKIKYEDNPWDDVNIKNLKIIKDFLPPPDQLVKKVETVKVTLELDKRSLDFFKTQALELSVPYQKMLCGLIDRYAQEYQR
jgi:predicted DNA binding CopG/RHH family protein